MTTGFEQAPFCDLPIIQSFVVPTKSLSQDAVSLVRVLHIINGEHFSGAERVQQFLGKRLPEVGFDAEFACVKPGKFRQLCGLSGDKLIDAPMHGRFDLRVVGQLVKIVRERNVAILHAHTPRTALVASRVSRRSGRPWIYHVHSPTARDSTRGLINRFNDCVERYSIRSCSCLITVSKSLRREMLSRGVSRRRLVSVPNGVAAIEPIDPSARVSQSSWKLGIVALMRPRKGVELALEAISKLKAQGRAISLELIGGFETEAYQQQILRQIESLGLQSTVHWSGFTSDVPSAIRRLDALVLPSLFGEGMPMVVLEALAAGVPVVATRVEGTPEVVRDGIEGVLAEPRNSSELASKIAELTSDRKRWCAMSSQALARHRSRFSDLEMARKVARIYKRVLLSNR